MSDRDLKNWDQRLKDQVFRNWDNYVRRRIDLSTARIAEFWGIAGEFIYVEEVSSKSAAASIRLNRNTHDAIDLTLGAVVKTIFKEFYITNTAQTNEWIDIIIGINFEYYKRFGGGEIAGAEAQPAVKLTHANADTDVSPASAICNTVLIKADVNNTQTAWIDFGTAAVQNACLPLDPGESVTVSLSNLDRIHANFEVGGECVFVIYEV